MRRVLEVVTSNTSESEQKCRSGYGCMALGGNPVIPVVKRVRIASEGNDALVSRTDTASPATVMQLSAFCPPDSGVSNVSCDVVKRATNGRPYGVSTVPSPDGLF
ncbi:unnamed protein product, partial [Iphiclides podalirius]